VIRRKVRFTATAQNHVRLLKHWWRENSAHPEILQQDLDKALATLSALPGIGSRYPSAPFPGVRRLYLERLMSHIYYTYDEGEVVIRALWHARRGSGPEFGSRLE
jgi:plasmid stabilization system protein ParE